ncbi:MAG: hypothetical protein LBU32_31030 [Clostridiales bacterium]|nr:hypothetical protein [Clostridiales bacterium]
MARARLAGFIGLSSPGAAPSSLLRRIRCLTDIVDLLSTRNLLEAQDAVEDAIPQA